MNFDTLYKEKENYVKRVCQRWVRNPERAEDVSQEFWLWVHLHLADFDSRKGTFKKWFVANLVFTIQNYIHHQSKKGRDSSREIVAEFTQTCNVTTNTINAAMVRASLLHAMRHLSEAQRRVMMVTLNTDLTDGEIARKLGMSSSGVKFHQLHAGRMMKKALKNQGVA